MSRKNFQVATDKGQTPTQDTKHVFATINAKKDKTPTGKVKTLKDKDALKKQREEDYINFRVNALKRRAKRMGLTEEQTKVKVEELLKQIKEPNNYMILIMFNPDNTAMLNEMLKNEGLAYAIQGRGYMWIEGEQDVLDIVRGFDIPGAKIHPYVKKKPPIIPLHDFEKSDGKTRINANGKRVSIKKRTKAEKKAAAKAAKNIRKSLTRIKGRNTNVDELLQNSRRGIMCFRKRVNEMRKSKAQRAEEKAARKAAGIKRKAYTGPFTGKTAAEKKEISAKMKDHAKAVKAARIASKKASGTTIPMNAEKASEGSKKASTGIKKAA